MNTPKSGKTHEMTPAEGEKTFRECVCATCYGELVYQYDWRQQISTVRCANPDCPSEGFVGRAWVARRQAENQAEAAEARYVLRDAMPWLPRKTSEQLLDELGF